MHNLAVERTITSDPVAYFTKWDSLTTPMVSVFQNLKYVSSKSAASTSHKQEILEAKITFVVANQEVMATKQEEMDDRMKFVDVVEDIMGAYLEAIMDLLKKQ